VATVRRGLPCAGDAVGAGAPADTDWLPPRVLAQAQGVPVRAVETLFLLGLALAVAVGIRAVGILPISALLVLPAAAARALCQSFRAMLVTSALLGALSLAVGFALALWQPIPPGAAVALVAATIFVLIALLRPAQGAPA
jgi:zinc transport system permease protein